MTVQDNVQSLISELEQILWQDQLKAHPEVSILLEKIRHHLLLGQSSLKNHDDSQVERLSEMILHRVEQTLSDRILQGELEQLYHQRDSLLQEIATLEQQKQALLSSWFPELSTDRELSSLTAKNPKVNNLNQSLETQFKPLLEELHIYAESLQEGIERMYGLGQQGETKFLAYLNHLQEKLEEFLQEEKIKNRAIIGENWYLGFDIENNQIEGYLFTFYSENNSLKQLKTYRFSELINLSDVKSFGHENILENVKEYLRMFDQSINTSSVTVENTLPLKTILEKIKAIVLICPSRWNERDRNLLKNMLRENLKLSQSKEIIWLPKSLALTLSHMSQNPLDKGLLCCVINLTESITELSIIDLSQGISSMITQQLFYGIQGIDQDILCHLIYPQWYEKTTLTFPLLPQPFPSCGMAETSKRKILKQSLDKNNLGNALIEASQLTRLILQQQEQFSSTLAQKSWSVNRQEMIETVINPWIKSIHEKLKLLLSQGHYSSDSMTHIIVAGEGIHSLDYALIPWLTRMFPNGKIIEAENQVKDSQILAGLNNLLANIG
ncbi:MAG: hypothetical protein QNJ33_15120 [Crocosphaera sp.]|nr:hypothetical protein [Crocosphaera sp.]